MAAYIEAAEPASTYFFNTKDADVLEGTADNVFDSLAKKNYRLTFGLYSGTDYAGAAAMGYAMGANTGLANSAYTLGLKSLVGVATDDLTLAQSQAIKGSHGNVYINRGQTYNLLEPGVMASGVYWDEVLGLDMLKNNIQLSVMDLLAKSPKVPQTEGGVTQIVGAIVPACEAAVNAGFLAPGIWTEAPLLNLATGDALPKGYLIQAESISSQSIVDRESRKAPPIYVAVKLAGAVQSAVIRVNVNR